MLIVDRVDWDRKIKRFIQASHDGGLAFVNGVALEISNELKKPKRGRTMGDAPPGAEVVADGVTPVGKTGNLRQSWTVIFARARGAAAWVVNYMAYAPHVEYGTQHSAPQPMVGTVLLRMPAISGRVLKRLARQWPRFTKQPGRLSGTR